MTWEEIRRHFPQQWLLIEALKARTENGLRILEDIAVIKIFDDSTPALKEYAKLHHESPRREMFVLHTDRENLNIHVRKWLGIRGLA